MSRRIPRETDRRSYKPQRGQAIHFGQLCAQWTVRGHPPRPPNRGALSRSGRRPFLLPLLSHRSESDPQVHGLLTHRPRRTLKPLRNLRPRHPRLGEAPEAPHILTRPCPNGSSLRLLSHKRSRKSDDHTRVTLPDEGRVEGTSCLFEIDDPLARDS